MSTETKPNPPPIKRSSQCDCCASQLGKELRLEHTKRVICDECLGFLARWIIELNENPQS